VYCSPELTWRDMQHIVILAARTEPLKDAHWVTNGVKRKGMNLLLWYDRALYLHVMLRHIVIV